MNEKELTDEEKAEIRESIAEGCREMHDVYEEIQREWEPLDDEASRMFYEEEEDMPLPNLEVVVRAATPDDDEAVAEVSDSATATLRETYRPKSLTRAHKPPNLTRLVAIAHDRVVGTVQYMVEGDRLHIIGLGVHSIFRRRGVARHLVAYLEGLATGIGARRLSLYTVKETGNVPVFQELGFETVSEQEDECSESDSYEKLTEVYMEKVPKPA